MTIGILVSAGLAVMAYRSTPPRWTAQASVLLLPPQTTLGNGKNPYLYLGGLGQAVDVLARRMNSTSTQRTIAEKFPAGKFTIAADTDSGGPILIIEAENSTAKNTIALTNAVVADLPTELSAMQAELDVTPNSSITSTVVTADSRSTINQKSRLQVTGLVGAAGVAVTILLAGLRDGLARRRRRSPAVESEPVEVVPVDAPTVSPARAIPASDRRPKPAIEARATPLERPEARELQDSSRPKKSRKKRDLPGGEPADLDRPRVFDDPPSKEIAPLDEPSDDPSARETPATASGTARRPAGRPERARSAARD